MTRLFCLTATILVSGCGTAADESTACQMALEQLNDTASEPVILMHVVGGHDGYSLVVPRCDFAVPLSIAAMPQPERLAFNRTVRDFIEQDERALGVGFLSADCDCRYDPRADVVNAASIKAVAVYRGPELVQAQR